MKENIIKYRDATKAFWVNRTKKQKGVLVASVAIILILIIGLSLWASNTKYVPLYNDLSVQEVGQIKEELDARKTPYELSGGGTTVMVPEQYVDSLLVDLAGEGIPSTGNIDYSFFSDNASWGITDNEFDVIKLDAMQTELANLMKSIEGIDDAKVMINIPKETVFVSEGLDDASASIVLNTKVGYQFKGNEMESLYHLVSKAVPNLPEDNIIIMNQHFEYFDKNSQTAFGNEQDYTYQQAVKKDTERDIQRRLQQMLGTMVGMDKVVVSVTADIDFTKENRVEELVDPVDLENMEGLPVSIESIHETYSGNQAGIGGPAGTGEGDIPNYPAAVGGEDGEYELVKETINNEFNRIRKEIVESPYKIRDLGIQVAVDNVIGSDGDEVEYLSQQDETAVETGVSSILNSMISTSIDKGYGEINPDEKISIVFQEFSGGAEFIEPGSPAIPLWMYIAGGILLLVIAILAFILIRKRRNETEEFEEVFIAETEQEQGVPEMDEKEETEADIRKKQLEKMASDKPEDFAKLLRSWIADD